MTQTAAEKESLGAGDEPPFSGSVDTRMVGRMRLILALSALLIIYIDPSEPDRLIALTYTALALYALYSAVPYRLSTRAAPSRITHWVDVGCYLLLVSLSSGTSSIFFFFFFFAILVASFRWGFAEGSRVTVISALLFTLIGYATAPAGGAFELNRFLLRPVYLLVLGYMIARFGSHELTLKRRLALLKEVNRLSNPRFGVDQTINLIMGRLRSFYDADACLLITQGADSSGHTMRRAERHNDGRATRVELPAAQTELPLLALPSTYAVAYNEARWLLRLSGDTNYYAYDLAKGARATDGREQAEGLANLLETQSFVTVPLYRRDELTGRLYLISRRRTFDHSDADFLRQVVEQIAPVIENIQLLDRLASEAADAERRKISRDIHDSTIQPYIGLKLGLDALRRKVAPGDPLACEIEDLMKMATEGITDLRRYVGGLKGETNGREAALLPAVRRQAAKFTEFYGIKVEVKAPTDLNINDRLAAEAFQIVSEGLSNIRRHTKAQHAVISLSQEDSHLVLRIENDDAPQQATPFVPRSITERATALGGGARVARGENGGHTTVTVEIPL